ncbi:MAG: Protein CcmA, bactofilin family [Bacilli bacterium]|nr:Protein CcmA, bactofilin family [Bacilli bacterium]
MENGTKGKLTKGNLSITGSSTATGGNYDKVNIVGEGTIDGDVECSRLKCIGTLDMDGHLKANRVGIIGTCSFSGGVQADAIKISGTVTIGGDIKSKELRCSGTIETQGNLYSEQIDLTGQLNTQGDCEAEVFAARGIFDIGGLLNAGQLDIRLYRDCQAKEIGGEKIRIRKASALNPFNFFFKPSLHAILFTSVIEGDEIYLEHTKANVVRGNHVTIGPGCDIGLVEYKEHFAQMKGAIVNENRKV